jgi:hypothetical protein
MAHRLDRIRLAGGRAAIAGRKGREQQRAGDQPRLRGRPVGRHGGVATIEAIQKEA